MKITLGTGTVSFEDNVLNISGEMQYPGLADYKPLKNFLGTIAKEIDTYFVINISELEFLDSSGQATLGMFALDLDAVNKDITVDIFGNSKYGWQDKFLCTFKQLWKNNKGKLNVFLDGISKVDRDKIPNMSIWMSK